MALLQTFNTYYALRHGHSVPNDRGIILSNPETGKLPEHGLTEQGRQQVQQSIQKSRHILEPLPRILIAHSPLSRAKESAEIAAAIIGRSAEVQEFEGLRERFFGEFEGQSNMHYQTVWNLDEKDSEHTEYGVESVRDVLWRVMQVIKTIESQFGCTALLVSHGDALQIVETAFKNMPPENHRKLPPLLNGELRLLSRMHSTKLS